MKEIKRMTICRAGSNTPTTVKAVTHADLVYTFQTAPELNDRQIVNLVGRLVYHEQRGEGKRGRRNA